ncbi:hypothetical protein BU15DRAFT_67336 [Melanogaster broomeanus]|nr:hypothetical protein BU15DRAFT_67336 [Melanogaster broomeanus]
MIWAVGTAKVQTRAPSALSLESSWDHLLPPPRQVKRNHRKPLVVVAPNDLRLAASSASFPRCSPRLPSPTNKIERIALVSGKIFYDLAKERAARGLEDRIALIRIEELAPFPFTRSEKRGAWRHVRTSGAVEWLWCRRVRYIGLREDAVPATGTGKIIRRSRGRSSRVLLRDVAWSVYNFRIGMGLHAENPEIASAIPKEITQ